MTKFFMKIPCRGGESCAYHGRVRADAITVNDALKERDSFAKSQPPAENFACCPGKPQLFMVTEVLIE